VDFLLFVVSECRFEHYNLNRTIVELRLCSDVIFFNYIYVFESNHSGIETFFCLYNDNKFFHLNRTIVELRQSMLNAMNIKQNNLNRTIVELRLCNTRFFVNLIF